MSSLHRMPIQPAAWLAVGLAAILFLFHESEAKSIKEHMFMSDVNLEHFYTIEENVLSHADILLQDNYFGAGDDEDEAEHQAHAPNLTEFRTVVESTKEIHDAAGLNLRSYLANPINVYHLLKRLSTKWKECIDLLMETKPCKIWNADIIRQRLSYLRKMLPGEKEIAKIISFTSTLQRIHNLRPSELAQGKLGGESSTHPLTVEEQYEFSMVLRDGEMMRDALVFLREIDEWLVSHSSDVTDLGFNRTNILMQMATAYAHLKDFKSALKTTEDAMSLDPSSSVAGRNLNYFKGKASTWKSTKRPSKYTSPYERRCAKPKPSRKTCFYKRFGLTFLKTEVVRTKPPVYLYHDVISDTVADYIRIYAHKKQTDKAWVADERYIVPDFRVSLHPKRLHGASRYVRAAAQTLIDAINFLAQAVVDVNTDRWGSPQVVNLGLDGMHLSVHDKDLGMVKPISGETAVFYTFLSEAQAGGEAVFSKLGSTVKPTKGSILFYYTSKQAAHSHCPVIGSSLWMVVCPIYEDPRTICKPEDEWL